MQRYICLLLLARNSFGFTPTPLSRFCYVNCAQRTAKLQATTKKSLLKKTQGLNPASHFDFTCVLHLAEQAASLGSLREQAEVDVPTLDVPVLERNPETVKQHKYKLRLGYDPRIFLEDPRMRGQQVKQRPCRFKS